MAHGQGRVPRTRRPTKQQRLTSCSKVEAVLGESGMAVPEVEGPPNGRRLRWSEALAQAAFRSC